MSTITNVALAGATGSLGPAVLEQLLKAGFQVTVLTRQGSTHDLPESVTIKPVDYDSIESLTAALRGQDAVVSTLGRAGLSKQLNLIGAAIKAGIKRFIPSEFGSDTTNDKTATLAVFESKVAAQKALAREAANGKISYTSIITGPFFDWVLKSGFLISPKEKTIALYGGGERYFSTTTLASIGKAVVGVLKKPEETKNRLVYVQDAAPTLKQLQAVAEKVTGAAWQGKEVSVENGLIPPAFGGENSVLSMIITSIWGEGYGSHFKKLDNELLGLKEFTEAEIEAVVATAAK